MTLIELKRLIDKVIEINPQAADKIVGVRSNKNVVGAASITDVTGVFEGFD